MKTNRLLIKVALSSAIAVSAFILTPGVVMGQVKIGSNPANIGTTSNLEVESTNGTKVVIDKTTGQLGAGVTDPTQSVDVSGTARLRNIPTNITNNLILTVDANGVIAKQNATAAQLPVVRGVIGSGIDIPQTTTSTWLYTGSSITLPANSRYVVSVSMIQALNSELLPLGSSLFLRSSFFNSPTENAITSDIVGPNLVSGLLPASAFYSILSGAVVIANTTNSPKTYYYKAGATAPVAPTASPIYLFGGSAWSENQIYAIPIN